VFTSQIGVDIFFESLVEMNLDGRHLGKIKIFALGSETAKALKNYHIIPDAIPDNYSNEGMLKLLKNSQGKRLLLPRSTKADQHFVEELSKDFEVDAIQCYETSFTDEALNISSLDKSDYISFTSSSTVEGFIRQLEDQEQFKNTGRRQDIFGKTVVIGPVTRAALEEFEIEADLMADVSTIDAMIDTILADVKKEQKEISDDKTTY
jgi:uroporphyrinogen-III synthase